jgi:hypothetical protein
MTLKFNEKLSVYYVLSQLTVKKNLHQLTPLERAQERLSADKAVTVLLNLLNSTDDFSLNLGATAVLWNLSVNGRPGFAVLKC